MVRKINISEVSDPESIKTVESLAREIWREHYIPIIGEAQVNYMLGKFQTAEAIARQIREENYSYYLAGDRAGDFVGYFAVVPKGGELFLSKIYLMEEARGKGYARQMMDFIEALARDRRCARIALTVNRNNRAAIGAYRRMGFSRAGTLVRPIGNGFVMDDYRMEKNVRVVSCHDPQ